jgi:hypothetical protein
MIKSPSNLDSFSYGKPETTPSSDYIYRRPNDMTRVTLGRESAIFATWLWLFSLVVPADTQAALGGKHHRSPKYG